jgi:hypothetical protein
VRRHEITDEKWKRMEPLLPGSDGDPGRSAEDNRRFANACLWIAKKGLSATRPSGALREVEHRLPAIQSLVQEWSLRGSAQGIGWRPRAGQSAFGFDDCGGPLACSGRKRGQETQSLGRSRGGFSTKIHVAVGGDGRPVRLRLTGGQCHDMNEADF